MAQVTDRNIGANPTGFDMRTEINNIIAALESDNSGSSAPLNTVAYMKWLDTSNATYYYVKERNHDNTEWVTLFRYTVATKIIEAVSNGVVLNDVVVHKTGDETKAGVLTFTSSPIVPTPAFGDNSTKTATTAFIKTKGVEYSSNLTYLTSATLTVSDVGKYVVLAQNTTTETLTLPSTVATPVGATLTVINAGTKLWTIKGSGTDNIYFGVLVGSTISLACGESFMLINRTDGWFALGSGASLGGIQGWAIATGSRVLGVTYTNSSAKPICIAIAYSAVGANNYINISTAGVVVSQTYSSAVSTIYAYAIIAPYGEYQVNGIGGYLLSWYEYK